MRIAGTHVLLTGATGAIGSRLALGLAERGARISLVARSVVPLNDLAGRVGGHAVPADLTEDDACAGVLAEAEAVAGPVDVVVHNAGAEARDELADADPAGIAAAVTLNLTAPLVLTRLVLPSMLERRRGHVVAVSSLAGVATFPGLSVYGGTKAGLTGAMAGLRIELAGTGVGTTVAEVGPVDSPMMDRVSQLSASDAAFARAIRLRALRMLSADEVARAVVDAVETGRRTVRLPRRAAPIAAVAAAPAALVRAVLTGVPTATAARVGRSAPTGTVR